jgi:hypothetical protein
MRIEAALAAKSELLEDTIVVDENGTRMRVTNWVVSPEEDEQIRQGYRCPFDMQVFPEAFPDECVICAQTPARQWFSPKLHQSDAYERMHLGEHRYGPSEINDYDYDTVDWQPKTQVLLPGKDF